MRRIKFSFIVVALLLLFWLMFAQDVKQESDSANLFQKDKATKINLVKKHSNKTSHKEKSIPKFIPRRSEKVITTYNEDSSVDKLLIYLKYQYCFDLMSPKTINSSLRLSNAFNKSSSEKKNIRLKEYRKICEEVSQQHPEFSFKKEFSFSDLNSANATSSFGKQLFDKNFGKNEAYHLSDKISDIKSVNADLFLSGNFLFYMDFQEVFQWDLYDLLHSNNPDYVRTIYNYAQDLYACRQGAACGKYSTLVLTKCIMNDAFCVEDFETLVKTQLTIGQQADIGIAYNYLLGKFGE